MNRHERIELDKAILEAAKLINARSFDRLTTQEIHEILKSKIPHCFTVDPSSKTDWDAWYDAKERWIANREYKDTGKNINIFHEGWIAARDYYQGKPKPDSGFDETGLRHDPHLPPLQP